MTIAITYWRAVLQIYHWKKHHGLSVIILVCQSLTKITPVVDKWAQPALAILSNCNNLIYCLFPRKGHSIESLGQIKDLEQERIFYS